MSRIKNPFYVGAQGIIVPSEQDARFPKYCRPTLEEAIEKAKDTLRKDSSLIEVPVVQIVVLVKRGEMPIVVEEV